MKQGILTNVRVRLLLSKGHSCYRPRRTGERRRKSVRGCIVDSNLSVLAMVIVKKGFLKSFIYTIFQNIFKKFKVSFSCLYLSSVHYLGYCVVRDRHEFHLFWYLCSNNDVYNSKPISLINLMFLIRSELLPSHMYILFFQFTPFFIFCHKCYLKNAKRVVSNFDLKENSFLLLAHID